MEIWLFLFKNIWKLLFSWHYHVAILTYPILTRYSHNLNCDLTSQVIPLHPRSFTAHVNKAVWWFVDKDKPLVQPVELRSQFKLCEYRVTRYSHNLRLTQVDLVCTKCLTIRCNAAWLTCAVNHLWNWCVTAVESGCVETALQLWWSGTILTKQANVNDSQFCGCNTDPNADFTWLYNVLYTIRNRTL